jgi:hypothetical protein
MSIEHLLSNCEFCEIQFNESHTWGQMNFHAYFPHLLPIFGEIWYKGSEHIAV